MKLAELMVKDYVPDKILANEDEEPNQPSRDKETENVKANLALRKKVGTQAYNYVARLHKNLGHPSPKILAAMMEEVQATKDVITCAKEVRLCQMLQSTEAFWSSSCSRPDGERIQPQGDAGLGLGRRKRWTDLCADHHVPGYKVHGHPDLEVGDQQGLAARPRASMGEAVWSSEDHSDRRSEGMVVGDDA